MSNFITLKAAKEMTARFKSEKENILAPAYRDKKILAFCETFDKADIQTLLDQTNCTQFRICYGMDVDNKVHAILVGVDASDDHLIPADEDADNIQVLDRAKRCPDNCPTNIL